MALCTTVIRKYLFLDVSFYRTVILFKNHISLIFIHNDHNLVFQFMSKILMVHLLSQKFILQLRRAIQWELN